MSKIEQLAAAFVASTRGEWASCGYSDLGRYIQTLESGEICTLKRGKFKQIKDGEYLANTAFIAQAHNLMPLLLEAIDLLETVSSARACQDHEFDVDAWFKQVWSLLGDLK